MKDILKGQNLIRSSMIVLAVLLIISVFVLQYGVADNGELTERLLDLGLYDCQGASATGEFATKFGVAEKTLTFSTADIPYLISKLFHPVDSAVSVFVPSAIYCILFMLGIYLIIKNLFSKFEWNNILLSVLCVLFFADTAYISFFNTPYVNAAQLSYCILMVGALIWATKSNTLTALIVAVVSTVLFVGTSRITAWIGIVLVIYFVKLIFSKDGLMTKILCVLFSILTIATSVFTMITTTVSETKLYNSVFYGVALADSSEAVELGFDSKTADELSGKAAFDEQAQEYLNSVDLTDKISYSEIALHYLKNPSLFTKNLKQVAMNSTMISTDYLGNYRYASGKGWTQTGFFKIYSTIKRRLVPASLTMTLVLLLVIAIGAVFYRKKYAYDKSAKQICDLTVIGVVSALIAFVLPLVYGGVAQIGFNMYLYNLIFDLCLLSAIVGGTKLLWIRREALKEKYGVNQ